MEIEKPAREPMTVGDAVALGLQGVELVCGRCGHGAFASFAALGVVDEMEVQAIAGVKPFVCSACGSRQVRSVPDWKGYKFSGAESF